LKAWSSEHTGINGTLFTHCRSAKRNHRGVDRLIEKKRPGKMTIIKDQQAPQLAPLIDQPQQAQRSFWTAKAFHGYISENYQIHCSYEDQSALVQ